jgi:histidinol-phosphate aminotransferase
LAGLRVGIAAASQSIINIFNRVKPPYNINVASQRMALEALKNRDVIDAWIHEVVKERAKLRAELVLLPCVVRVYPSDANFLLVKVRDPSATYTFLVAKGIIVRDRSRVELCEGCLRITVGTIEENKMLLAALREYGE